MTTPSPTSHRGPPGGPARLRSKSCTWTAERVRGAAVKILDQLETSKVGDGTPPGLDRDALAQARSTGRRAPGVSYKLGRPVAQRYDG